MTGASAAASAAAIDATTTFVVVKTMAAAPAAAPAPVMFFIKWMIPGPLCNWTPFPFTPNLDLIKTKDNRQIIEYTVYAIVDPQEKTRSPEEKTRKKKTRTAGWMEHI